MDLISLSPRLILNRIGKRIYETLQIAGGLTELFLQVLKELFNRPFYFRLVLDQVYDIGVKSFFLTAVTAVATGSVMSLQFGYGLARFGGKLYVPKVVALSILREMGPVFTSLLVAGRVGSGIASEISSMNITQQIDAIRALGTSPIKRIVIPRLLACLIAIPILTLFADYIAVLSSMLVSLNELGIDIDFFISKCAETLRIADVLTGCLKAMVFAFFIGITACWKGLNAEKGTQGVGNATTWVVVTSCVFIVISDVFMTKLFFLTIYNKAP